MTELFAACWLLLKYRYFKIYIHFLKKAKFLRNVAQNGLLTCLEHETGKDNLLNLDIQSNLSKYQVLCTW